MSESPQNPESPAPESPAPENPAPVAPASAAPAGVQRPSWRDRLPATLPALVLLVVGTLLGALLTLGIGAVVDDDHHRGPYHEDARWQDGPMGGDRGGHLRGGPGFGR